MGKQQARRSTVISPNYTDFLLLLVAGNGLEPLTLSV